MTTIAPEVQTTSKISLRIATSTDREQIYRARHAIYATQLKQHPENEARELRDSLDSRNHYVVAARGKDLLGFVSITPPGGSYSVDKYFRREQIPVPFDDELFEIRLLTVMTPNTTVAPLLMYGALRYVEAHAGKNIVAIGRQEIMKLYERCGMRPVGLSAKSGAVTYNLMTATVAQVHAAIAHYEPQLQRYERGADWCLPFAFRQPQKALHGGAFWQALGEDFSHLDRASDVVNADVLDAWFPPAPAVLSALRDNLELLVRTSPPTNAEGMVRAISKARNIPAANVLTAAGSSALIFLAFTKWLTRESRVLLAEPTYAEYRHVLTEVVGCRVDSVIATREQDFRLDLGEFTKRAAMGYDLAVIVNPNSPTGTVLSASELRNLFESAPCTRFWIDETYVEYAGSGASVESEVSRLSNVFICKSMSKVYALSGVRAAYLAGSIEGIEGLSLSLPPWAVSAPAQIAAIAALHSPEYYEEQYRTTAKLRSELASNLKQHCGIECLPSIGNFMLCELPEGSPNANEVVSSAQREGVFLRSAESIHPLFGPRLIRVAVKDAKANSKIVDVLSRLVCTDKPR